MDVYVQIALYTQKRCWLLDPVGCSSPCAVHAGLGLTKALTLAASHSNTSGWGSLASRPGMGQLEVIFLGNWRHMDLYLYHL